MEQNFKRFHIISLSDALEVHQNMFIFTQRHQDIHKKKN